MALSADVDDRCLLIARGFEHNGTMRAVTVTLVSGWVLSGCVAGSVVGPDVSTDGTPMRDAAAPDEGPSDAASFDSDPEPPLDDASAGAGADAVTPLDAPLDSGAIDVIVPPRDGAGPSPVTRTIGYRMATYTMRHNWVHDCGRGYAYTAQGSEHLSEDCDGLYRPDGTRRGTATFTFTSVIASMYDVLVASRFTANRDPNGALFIVNGERFTVDQRMGSTIVNTTLARRSLAGSVTVVLDNSMNAGSDSVQSVTLRPAP